MPAGQAHDGACIGLRWNLDGTALATCGEDGKVKLWSKTGMLRSSLAAEQQAVYCVAFSPDSNLLALCSGKHVVVKRIGGTNAQRTQFTGAVEGGAGGAARREEMAEQQEHPVEGATGSSCPSTGPWRTARSSAAGRTGGIRSGTPTVGCCSRAPW